MEIEKKITLVIKARPEVHEGMDQAKEDIEKAGEATSRALENTIGKETKQVFDKFNLNARGSGVAVRMMASQIGESAGPVGQLASQFFTLGTQLGLIGIAVGAVSLAISGAKKLIELNNEAVKQAAENYKKAADSARDYLKSIQKLIEDKAIENAHWTTTRIKLMEARLAYMELETALIAYQDRLRAEYEAFKRNTGGWKEYAFALAGFGGIAQATGNYVEQKLNKPLEKTNPLLEELRQQIKELEKDKDKLDKPLKIEAPGSEDTQRTQDQAAASQRSALARLKAHKTQELKEEQAYAKAKILYLDKVNNDIASMEEENYNRRIQIEQNAFAIMEENDRNTKAVMLQSLTAFVDEGVSGLVLYLSDYLKIKALEAGADAIFATFKGFMALASYQYQSAANWFSAAGTAAGFAVAYGAGSAIAGAIGNASRGGGGAAASSSAERRSMQTGSASTKEEQQSSVTNIYIYGHNINTNSEYDKVFYDSVKNYENKQHPDRKQTKI